jgi:hypothetical protein
MSDTEPSRKMSKCGVLIFFKLSNLQTNLFVHMEKYNALFNYNFFSQISILASHVAVDKLAYQTEN